MRRTRILPIAIAAWPTLLVVIFLAIGCLGGDSISRDWPEEPFSPSAWQRTAPEERYIFFHSLSRSSKLADLTRNEVVTLLGPPSYQAPDLSYMTYILKQAEPGDYGFDAVYLLQINFEIDSGRVKEYYLRGD